MRRKHKTQSWDWAFVLVTSLSSFVMANCRQREAKAFAKCYPFQSQSLDIRSWEKTFTENHLLHAHTPQSSQFLPVSDPAEAQLKQESRSGQIFLKFSPKSEKRQKCRVDLLLADTYEEGT